jgi:hypothetical protein
MNIALWSLTLLAAASPDVGTIPTGPVAAGQTVSIDTSNDDGPGKIVFAEPLGVWRPAPAKKGAIANVVSADVTLPVWAVVLGAVGAFALPFVTGLARRWATAIRKDNDKSNDWIADVVDSALEALEGGDSDRAAAILRTLFRGKR